jgi:alkaline phosphatase D
MSRRRFAARLSSAALAYLVGVPRARAGEGHKKRSGGAIWRRSRPVIPCGVASGDITASSGVVWSRCDRPAKMFIEFATTESFRDARQARGAAALGESDFTAKVELTDLPPGQTIFYRVSFQDLAEPKAWSEPATGSFRTAPRGPGNVFFAWSGDTAGQGFGINREWGGMKIFETIRRLNPQFFLHSGDVVYADNPIPPEIQLDDGTIWKNVVTESKSKVAETLDEFRGNFVYNLLDDNVRHFNASVPQLVQWDDHETRNNWYPGQMLDDDRYQVKSCSLLASRSRQAFFEYTPIRSSHDAPGRIYRSFAYGPLLDVFLLDQRSYRGPNSSNRQLDMSDATALLGTAQLQWFEQSLLASQATWKVIGNDLPIGLIVRDGPSAFENVANGDGAPRGRELEFAQLLRFIKSNRIKNVVWLTADVHYAAAHYYDPRHAQLADFDPFWEFVAGPLNAGTFGAADLDNTFGPQVKFQGIPAGMKPNRPPTSGFQFFGTVFIDGQTEVMTVALHNLAGEKLYSVDLAPDR